MKSLSLVVKLAERCNLNCTYCYVFNQGNESYRTLPKVITEQVREHLPAFIRDLREAQGFQKITVIFHGGEPLLLKRAEFDLLCRAIRAENPTQSVSFSLQTNGVLLNAAWVEVLTRHGVEVGVSLDGDARLNAQRVYHNGRESYRQAVAGWTLVRDAYAARDREAPIILCAITGDQTVEALAHFIDLGVTRCDLIMPSQTADATTAELVSQLEDALPRLFDAWWDNRDRISVRSLRYICHVMAAGPRAAELVQRASHQNATISVDTAGQIGPDSSLLPAGVPFTNGIFSNDAAQQYFAGAIAKEVLKAETELPGPCQACTWVVACRGQGGTGNLITRFRADSRFKHETAFCSALKPLYRRAAQRLAESGVPQGHIAQSLNVSEQVLEHELAV